MHAKQKSACRGRYNLSKYEHNAMHARGHDLLAITSDVRLLQAVRVTAVLNTLSCHVSFKHKKKCQDAFQQQNALQDKYQKLVTQMGRYIFYHTDMNIQTLSS